ncbi:sugar ABC transporter substrate-binding protein [Helicovermis profundi]|uniref:D-xylose ABC transporter substrate-binding protein n=1 Tax=Helicovermis profundi TaxID=3065157 RepID=A0AAU9EUZ6_9FIRM|nr:D-xylose ABC transporter substrate-binding protein [Clostridia bacterium S502]
MKLKKVLSTVMIAGLLLTSLTGCASKPVAEEKTAPEVKKQIVIGFSMDTLKEERWQKDRDIFVAEAEKLGAKVLVQAANGDDSKQVEQAENLLAQGVDVLVVVPHNGKIAASIVESAHAENVPVLAYDRLVDGDVDYYISFDNEKVGELQADYVTKKLGITKGNFVYIGGAPTDNNALLFRAGAVKVLKSFPDIKIVYDQYSKDWQPSEAQKHMENALTATNNDVVAVIAANDGTAGGASAALAEQKLNIPLTGQDAEIAACQRIVEGTQSMTVFKPIQIIAENAAKIAVDMANGSEIKTTSTVKNSVKEVPSILLSPVVVDKDNMKEVIVDTGFHSEEDVYRNVQK